MARTRFETDAGASGAHGPCHVVLFHAYRDSENTSMRLYARHLGGALEQRGLAVEHVSPESLLPDRLHGVGLLSRLESLWGRFVRYPRIARRARGSIFHIVEQSQAHLVDSVDPRRVVVTCHDLILLALAVGKFRSAYRDPIATSIFRRSVRPLRRAAHVVAVSEQTRRDLVELLELDADRIDVIPPGLDATFRPRPEEREGARRRLGLDGSVLLHVGHTGFYKNIEGCLRILARLRHQGTDARLVRVGEPLRPAQRALLERLGLRPFVREAGRATIEELAQLYITADVLLFPSLYEGFGWPPLEAMASGLPVVCSNAGSLPEVAGEAALMAAAEDEEELTRCVAEVLAQPAVAADMRARGLRAAARYSWDVTAARLAGVYERVLERA